MKEKFLPCIKNSLRFAVIFTIVYSFMGEVVRFSSETGKILYFITFRNFVTAFFVSFLVSFCIGIIVLIISKGIKAKK